MSKKSSTFGVLNKVNPEMRKMLLWQTVERVIGSVFGAGLFLYLMQHITATEYAAKNILDIFIGLPLASAAIKYKKWFADHFKVFIVLDILTNIFIAIMYIITGWIHVYWILGYLLFPFIIQGSIDACMTRIENRMLGASEIRVDYYQCEKMIMMASGGVGATLCAILDKLDIFDLNLWVIAMNFAWTISSLYLITLNKKFYEYNEEDEDKADINP